MDYFIPIFLLLNYCLFSAFSSGNESIEDDALVELAKGPEYFNKFCAEKGLIINEKNQFLSDKYEAHLGILYFLRMEWNSLQDIIKKFENFRQYAFILYEYMFWQYVAEYVKAVDPALAEQISIVKKPIKPELQNNWNEATTFCDAIQNWAYVWKKQNRRDSYENTYFIYLMNTQTLIDAYALNLNKWYEQESLFDMQKLKMKLNANSKFDNSFPRLRKMFDFNMAKLKTMAMKKVSRDAFVAAALIDCPSVVNEALRRHTDHTLFYGIDNAIDDNIFFIGLKEMRVEKFGAKLETAPLSANAKSLIQTNKWRITSFLSIIYMMRLKWQCSQIENYQNECTKFRKYFNFLYEYLFRECNEADNSEMPQQFAAVRPNFIFGSENKIRSLIDVVSQLARIGAFFFDPTYAKEEFDNNLDEFFKKWWKPKLLNELEVSGEKTIGQKVYESVANIGKSPKKVQKEKATAAVLAEKQQLTFNLSRANFDILMKENFEKRQTENDYHEAHRVCKWLYLSTNKKTGELSMLQVPKPEMPKAQLNDGTAISDDDLFLAFVEDSANFENHCIEMERQNLLARVGLLSKRKGKGKYEIGETVRYLTVQYEAYLGVVYLLKKKWNCEKIYDHNYSMYGECKKFKEYLLVLYEFLFRKYLEVNYPYLTHEFATTERPIFELGNSKTNATIIDVLENLWIIWAFFFDYAYGQKYQNKLENLFKQKAAAEPKWLNEETIGQIIVKNLQQITKFGADFKQIFGREKSDENEDELKQSLIDEATNQHSSKPNSDKAIQFFREAFDGIIKSMAETAKTMEESEEGFGKTKKVLSWLFL